MRGERAVGLLAVLLAGCGERGKIEAPAPPRALAAAEAESLPPPVPGTIEAPLAVDLASALAALERIIPARLGDLEDRKTLPLRGSRQASFAFLVAREPFQVSFARDTLLFSSVIHYRGRAWLNPTIGPEISGGCGIDEDPPRARLVVRVVPRLTQDWQLQVNTRVAELAALTTRARDQCQVTFLKVNVTEKVLQAAREALEKRLPEIQERIAAVDLRSPLTDLWNELQEPIRLEDSLWLLLRPAHVHVGRLSGSKRTVNADLGFTAAPRIVTGPKPLLEPIPLPPVQAEHYDSGFSLPVEGAFDYDVLSTGLTERLQGKSVKAAGGEFRVQRVTVYGIGKGQLALGIDFDGTARGRVWLIGTPRYDPGTGLLTVPDLDFDASSAGLLAQAVAWLKGEEIREFLRQEAQISAGDLLGKLQNMAVREMNRPLAPGISLEAKIDSSEAAQILVGPRRLVLRARATGSARLVIGKEVFERVGRR
ncbi:MAG: DUF4403 family protein [Gemmatimonadales bacterium]